MSAMTAPLPELAHELLSFALLARASYGEGASVEDQVRDLGLAVEDEWHQGALDAYAVGNDRMLAIVGPGTRSWAQIKLDLDAELVPVEARAAPDVVRVHRGVNAIWEALRPWVERLRAIDTAHVDGREMVYCGHSLFGMVAHRATIDLPPDRVWTYGAGRCGDATFCATYERLQVPTARVVHDRDLIPTVPYGDGYQHVGGRMGIADGGTIATCVDDDSDSPVPAWRQWLADLDGQAERDHRIATYVLAASLAQRLQAPRSVETIP